MRYLCLSTFFACLFIGLMDAAGQTQLQPQPAAAEPQVPAAQGGLLIGPGDTIRVRILNTPELSEEVRINETGTARLPLIGELQLSGLTEDRAAVLIDQAYIKGGYVLHPNAAVLIVSYTEKGVSITGEVVRPGIYPVTGPRTLVDIIALAGGLTISADTRITIQFADGSVKVFEFPVDKPEKDFENSKRVSPGDRIIVPRAGVVYVLGQVSKPGGYLMQRDGHLTALEAVSEAGGSTRLAYESHVVLLRPSDNYKPVPLYLNEMYKGQKPDVQLQSNDIIYVPSSTGKDFLVNLPQILGTLAGAAIYAINVSH